MKCLERGACVCLSLREILKKKRCLGHHLVIFGFSSYPVVDIALVLISTDQEPWDLLELWSPAALEEWNGKAQKRAAGKSIWKTWTTTPFKFSQCLIEGRSQRTASAGEQTCRNTNFSNRKKRTEQEAEI